MKQNYVILVKDGKITGWVSFESAGSTNLRRWASQQTDPEYISDYIVLGEGHKPNFRSVRPYRPVGGPALQQGDKIDLAKVPHVSWQDFINGQDPEVEDLTMQLESAIMVDMTTQRKIPSLIPNAKKYLDNGFNLLLIGPHGTGKTQSLMDLCKEEGITMKYYSCSTLDPYTDLVGVPFPEKDEDGKRHLDMVRPREIDEAELIFFDEFNRADAKTLNAIFEIIQFKSINGEPLPKLKACWAAMNPPTEEYQVEDIDPALLDRFDLYIPIEPQPDVAYMSQFMPEAVAEALKFWWDGHERKRANELAKNPDTRIGYISPRRLVKIGLVWMATEQAMAVKQALPPHEEFDSGKLVNLLRAAMDLKKEKKEAKAGLGDAAGNFDYSPDGIMKNKPQIRQHLEDNPLNMETHKAVLDGLSEGVGGKMLVDFYGDVLNAVNPAQLEAFVANMPEAKKDHLRVGFTTLYKSKPGDAKKMTNLYKVLSKDARPGTMPVM